MGTEGEIIFQTYILACYFRTGCARVKENRSSSKIIKKIATALPLTIL